MRRDINSFLFFYTIVLLLFVWAEINADVSQETKIKAVFIYNFSKYVHWSESDTSGVFKIAVFGKSDIMLPLMEIAGKKLANGRKIIIEQYTHIEDIKNCHILFIPSSEKKRILDILHKIRYQNILSVSENRHFANMGGAINFILTNEKIKMQINRKALSRAGLNVSSQLLKLAILIEENKEKLYD